MTTQDNLSVYHISPQKQYLMQNESMTHFKQVKDSQVDISELMLPSHSNFNGKNKGIQFKSTIILIIMCNQRA